MSWLGPSASAEGHKEIFRLERANFETVLSASFRSLAPHVATGTNHPHHQHNSTLLATSKLVLQLLHQLLRHLLVTAIVAVVLQVGTRAHLSPADEQRHLVRVRVTRQMLNSHTIALGPERSHNVADTRIVVVGPASVDVQAVSHSAHRLFRTRVTHLLAQIRTICACHSSLFVALSLSVLSAWSMWSRAVQVPVS